MLQDKDSVVLVITPAAREPGDPDSEANGDVLDVSLEMWAARARQGLPYLEKMTKRACCIVEGNAPAPGDAAASSVLSS